MKPVLPNSSVNFSSNNLEGEISARLIILSSIVVCILFIIILFIPPHSQVIDWFTVSISKFGFNKIDSSVSPEAQKIIKETRTLSIVPEGIQELEQKFTKALKDNGEDLDDYYSVYSALWAHYNVSKEEKAFELMEYVEGVIAQRWPDIHETIQESGGFLPK